MKAQDRVLVAGAAGFLGRLIVDHLAASGHAVTATARRPAPDDLPETVSWIVWDGHGTPPDSLNAQIVIDCAAAIPATAPRADVMLGTNVRLATATATIAARSGARLLVGCSSMSVYGRPNVAEITDDTPTLPDQPYGLAKLAAEAIWAETVTRGEVAGQVSLRLPAVLGTHSHHNFPSTFAEKMTAGQPVTVFNPDGLYNTCVHGADIAAFIAHLIESRPTGVHKGVIAAREPMRMIEAVGVIADAMGVTPQLEIKPANQAATTVRPQAMTAIGYQAATVADTLSRFGKDRRA
jgi:UDP-glucose 4-epimerase